MDNLRRGSFSYSKKRGQVTIFILIGLVLVMSVAVVMYISEQTLLFKSSKFLPGDVKPAAEFIEHCIEDAGKEAINLVGLQGGYVYVPEYLKSNPSANINHAGIKVPYWYYEGRDSSPSIEIMQDQIAQFVDEHVEFCVDNMSAFSDQYEIEILDKPNTEIILGKTDVIFETNYHIILKDKNGKSKLDIEMFKTSVPVALKKVYELGKRILEKENQEMFLEKATVDLMAMNSEIPFSGLNFKCIGGPMQWKVSDINNQIKASLKKDISRIRVKNTDYIPFEEPEENYEILREYDVDKIDAGEYPDHVPVDSYDYFHYFWDIKYTQSDLKVGFNYLPEFGNLLRVRPSNNGIMKSNVAKGAKYLNFLCFHLYHFSYDLNYPVEVMIRDDNSYDGDGYVFRFAMPVMIDHNLPNREKVTQSLFDYSQSDNDFSSACDDKKGSYDIIIRGYDDYFYESELENVSLYYDCLKYSCHLGETEFESGSDYRLTTGLPEGCRGGFIDAEKEGYLPTTKQMLSSDIENGFVEFWMPKLNELNYEIMVLDYDSNNETFGVEKPFEGTATIHLILEGYEFEEIKLGVNGTINILVEPAKTYSLEIILLDKEDEMVGGYKGNWTVSYNDMKDKEKIVFRTFKYLPEPLDDDSLMNMYLFMFDGDYSDELKPRFEDEE